MADGRVVCVDVGTGDGRAVLDAAGRRPDSVVIGLDPVASALAGSSRRAALPSRKGGLPNALFAVGSAEAPPLELVERAAEVTITLPWGSLLRGVLGRDDAVTAGVVSLVRPWGSIRILLAPDARDGAAIGAPVDIPGSSDAIAAAWARAGARLTELRTATAEEIRMTGSTWAKRLALGRPGTTREARLLLLERDGNADTATSDATRV